MRTLMLMALAVAAPIASPAAAQIASPPPGAALPGAERRPAPSQGLGQVSKNAPVNGVLVLYGNERCPTNNEGDEVVVCVRRSAQEQYRVPKELREFQITPENESWAVKAQGTTAAEVGVNGIGSCSVVGAGGQSGCFAQQARQNRRVNDARKAAEADSLPR